MMIVSDYWRIKAIHVDNSFATGSTQSIFLKNSQFFGASDSRGPSILTLRY